VSRPAPVGRRQVAGRVVAWLLSVGLLVVVGLALRDRWSDVRDVGGLPGAVPIGIAVLVHGAANAVLASTWRNLAAVGGTRLPWRTASWVWALSQLARYGLSGAQVAGRAVVARRYGMTATSGGVSALVEVAWQVAINGVVLLATLPWWLPGADELSWVALAGVVPAAVLVMGSVAPVTLLRIVARAVAWGPVTRLTRGRWQLDVAGISLGRAEAARLTALFVLNAGLRFAAFVVILAAIGGPLPEVLPRAAGAFALGQFVGRIAVFAPGGIGPREGATALVIAPVLGGGGALLLVAVMRLTEVAGELAFLAAARTWRPPSDAAAAASVQAPTGVRGGRGPSS
jgi:hypothetical protein